MAKCIRHADSPHNNKIGSQCIERRIIRSARWHMRVIPSNYEINSHMLVICCAPRVSILECIALFAHCTSINCQMHALDQTMAEMNWAHAFTFALKIQASNPIRLIFVHSKCVENASTYHFEWHFKWLWKMRKCVRFFVSFRCQSEQKNIAKFVGIQRAKNDINIGRVTFEKTKLVLLRLVNNRKCWWNSCLTVVVTLDDFIVLAWPIFIHRKFPFHSLVSANAPTHERIVSQDKSSQY